MAIDDVPVAPEDYDSYIKEMLRQLADMAHRNGHHRLERSIRHAAAEADGTQDSRPPEARH